MPDWEFMCCLFVEINLKIIQKPWETVAEVSRALQQKTNKRYNEDWIENPYNLLNVCIHLYFDYRGKYLSIRFIYSGNC